MEGPSLFLASEQLQPFCGKEVLKVTGTDPIDHTLFLHKRIVDIFSWGKHLVFQFDNVGLRVHFMLFGTYEAVVEGQTYTGDYKKSGTPKLVFEFENGVFEMYHSSLKIIEGSDVKKYYDFSTDILSRNWDPLEALRKVELAPNEEIGDILLDQDIFSGVGNVIRNESLWIEKILPTRKVNKLSTEQLQHLIKTVATFSKKFLDWRRTDSVHDHDKVYRKVTCSVCGGDITRKRTGKAARWSYFCSTCQT